MGTFVSKRVAPVEKLAIEGLILKAKSPKAPAHLSDSTRVWWRLVVRDYELEAHHLRLLQAAGECWDRLQQARELLARDGLVIEGREGGMRPHPAAAIERDSRIAFARLIRELDLDVEPPTSTRTGPASLRSNRRGGYAG
ncbi:P27 family phage terminase small subunit [Bradyrhizobium sp. JYMT SZCCT0428]|uniref:P27 family phage terminase small subunit n=1 Tax=Bradyrhizobium sp. JYMT SZCCT0428 TaxID=2807673 RepID=UPI002897F97C|nr:P27 family phage terminase small subunit [Bradyrhizobium sp. JYMT SZCCT0428]